MKYAYGWALPDDDVKCERYLAHCPLVSGRHAYQAQHIQATLHAMRSCRVAVDNSGLCYVKAAGKGTTAVHTLDSFKLTDVDHVKIDVEGYERFVLKGARKTLRAWKPVIVVEQKSHGERYGSGQYDALGYLQAMGAQVVERVVDDFILAWP